MPKQTVEEKLLALYRASSEQLTDFFKGGSFDRFGIRANEFEVFCAFWATACYLRSATHPAEGEVERFNRSVVVAIVDRVIATSIEELSEEKISSLSQTVLEVFVERFSGYRHDFQADLREENSADRLFPRLVEAFLTNVLDGSVPHHSPVRQLLDGLLAEMLERSATFLGRVGKPRARGKRAKGQA